MYIVIAGNPDSTRYALATLVAQRLKTLLPNFDYKTIPKLEDWKNFLENLNKTNGWNFIEQPIIWREFLHGGKKHILGGLGDFFEHCYVYYGFDVELIPFNEQDIKAEMNRNKAYYMAQDESPHLDIYKSDVEKMTKTNLRDFEKSKITHLSSKRTIISICGAAHEMTGFLLNEIINLRCLNKSGIEIRLFNPKGATRDINNFAYLYNTEGTFGNKPFVKPVKTMAATISECDYLIVMMDFRIAKIKETRHQVLSRVINEAEKLAGPLNEFAKRALRVIVFNYNIPNCFFANYLINHVKSINMNNIVVPTSYSGMKLLDLISKKTGVKLENLSAPPIWGADEINMYFDMRAILYKGHVCKPFKRSLRTPPSSTLPLGVVETELRYLSHLIQDEHIIMKEYKVAAYKKKWMLRFPTIFAKVRCIMDILRIWAEKDTESIISLGICSNGTFDLPKGLVLSQPTYFKNGYFEPCSEYPVSARTLKIVKQIGLEVNEIVQKYVKDEN